MSRVSTALLLLGLLVIVHSSTSQRYRGPRPNIVHSRTRPLARQSLPSRPYRSQRRPVHPFLKLFAAGRAQRPLRRQPAFRRRPAPAPGPQKRDFKVKQDLKKNTFAYNSAEDIPGFQKFTLSEAIVPEKAEQTNKVEEDAEEEVDSS